MDLCCACWLQMVRGASSLKNIAQHLWPFFDRYILCVTSTQMIQRLLFCAVHHDGHEGAFCGVVALGKRLCFPP